MQKYRIRLKKYGSLDFYYAILRKDWKRSTIFGDMFLKILAVLVISGHRFIKDSCIVSASALTFYSVLSLVPIVALVLGIAKGFGVYSLLENQLHQQTFTNPEIVDFVLQFANQALENTQGGLITGIGIVFLLWAVIKVLGNTELAMNQIWGVVRGRSVTKKFTDYLSIMFIAPIFVVLISSINVFLTSNLQTIAMEDGFLSYASSLIITLLNFLPFILVWMLFIFLYMFMPTTRVRFKYALLAGIVAGSVYQVVQWFYIRFQIGVSSYNAIYGSLAALPLLLVWLQLSWSIVLWGTELCYIMKNRHFMFRDVMDKESRWIDNIDLSLQVLTYISKEYIQNNGVPTLEKISAELCMSTSKLQVVLQQLTDKGILAETGKEDDRSYLPVIDLYQLSWAEVIIRLSNIGDRNEDEWEKRFVKAIYQEFGEEKFAYPKRNQ
ncbi:YihY/virulence factor BrkB family protein [Odoribacter laneus]|jgi:yihY family protein|uniref:YihY/virulence factor BrkB family protein n=1 Tax=Odoribacter laneus TaxID=626933 RepID=UPI00033FFED6|nr:YihY/virulence factor BrkB family protein [Odoribacter laneus]CCZ82460.1 yihY family protein [Odoribacter laneus CAG:561]